MTDTDLNALLNSEGPLTLGEPQAPVAPEDLQGTLPVQDEERPLRAEELRGTLPVQRKPVQRRNRMLDTMRLIAWADGGDDEARKAAGKDNFAGSFLNPYSMAAPESRAAVLGKWLCRSMGTEDPYVGNMALQISDRPTFYTQAERDAFFAMKEKMPEFKTQDEAYAYVWQQYEQKEQGNNARRKARMEAQRDTVERTWQFVTADDAWTQQDTDRLPEVYSGEQLENLRAVRGFFKTYIKPLEKVDNATAVLEGIAHLQDEFYDVIGDNEERAQMAYEGLMRWAEAYKQSGKVGVADEFSMSLRNRLQNWADTGEKIAGDDTRLMSVQLNAGGGMQGVAPVAAETYERGERQRRVAQEKWERQRIARATLRATMEKARELGDDTGFFEGAARVAAMAAGDTALYMLGPMGSVSGTMDAFMAAPAAMDSYELDRLVGDNAAGLADEGESAVRAVQYTAINAVVELTPWGRVGGKGLSYLTRGAFAKGAKPGAFTRWVARTTQTSVPRAMAAEIGASFIDEAVLEPVMSGGLTWLTDRVLPNGRSRTFEESMGELTQVWNDPRQSAGILLFSAALSGAGYRGMRENVRYFTKNRSMLMAQGLTLEQAEEITQIADHEERFEAARKAVADGWKNDAAGMAARVRENNRDLAERGEVLVYTGEGTADPNMHPDADLARAYAGVWQFYAEQGVLPRVQAVEDGKFKVTKQGTYDVTLGAADADALLRHEVDALEQAWYEEAVQRVGKRRAETQRLNVRADIVEGAAEIAGEAAARTVGENADKTGVDRWDLVELLPLQIAQRVKAQGRFTLADMEDLLAWTQGAIDGTVELQEREWTLSAFRAAGIAQSYGDLQTWAQELVNSFGRRADMSGVDRREAGTAAFRTRTNRRFELDGRELLGNTMMTVQGTVRTENTLEELTESYLTQIVQERVAALLENQEATRDKAGTPKRTATDKERTEAEQQAWREVGESVKAARDAALKADPEMEIEEWIEDDAGSIIENFSTLAVSRFMTSGAVPSWVQPLREAAKGLVASADAITRVQQAMQRVSEETPDAMRGLEQLLDKMQVRVSNAYTRARITQADVRAWREAHAYAAGRAAGPGGVGGAAVTEAVQEAQEDEEAITERETSPPVQRAETVKQAAEETAARMASELPAPNAPAGLAGVFDGDRCVHNVAGNYYCGLIDKDKLKQGGIAQVKVGAKGEHGVIAGRELTGDFEPTVAPLYVWQRKDGELWLISGRHRYAKLMEDATVTQHMCYVFREGEEFAGVPFDEKWARMMDFENNMRDDQADEITAGTYARETGYPDAYMRAHGLLRNESRSKRGIFIGRHARTELWTLFANGKVTPKDAQIICEMTRSIKDESRINDIQGRCAALLAEGKSWEYIGAVSQLLANKEAVTMHQGLLDLGADFEADMGRMARWIELNLRSLNESISLLNGEKKRAKKGDKASRLGLSATMTAEQREKMLADLNTLKAQFELIGSYPDLVAQAQMWDGDESRFTDPVELYLDRAQQEREQQARESAMPAEDYLEEQARKEAEEATPMFSWSVGKKFEPVRAQRVTSADDAKVALKPFQGKMFRNAATDVNATVTSKTLGKSHAAQLSVKNLMAVGYTREDALTIHFSAFAHIHELFESSPYGFFEENYDKEKKRGRAGAWHYLNTIYVDGFGYFDVNVSALKPENEKEGNRLFSLELTIENPGSEGTRHPFSRGLSFNSAGATGRILAAYRSFVEKEMLIIRKKAEQDGTFMKAPNGKATELTEDQWLQVRTNAFKKWFGDWEKDPANASKVLDENGEPLVVYHFTDSVFTAFDVSKARQNADIPAIFFSSGTEDWSAMGGRVMACYLNIRNPKEGKPIVNGNGREVRDALVADGYDGTIDRDEDVEEVEYAAFRPEQVKSATDNRGTFDSSTANITHSVIGPKAQTWARYAGRTFKGRDDGKERAELDASKARLRFDLRAFGSISEDDVMRSLMSAIDTPEAKACREELKAWAESWIDGLPVDREEAIKRELYLEEKLGQTPSDYFADATMWKLPPEKVYKVVRDVLSQYEQGARMSVRDELAKQYVHDTNGTTLGKVLDFPELFEAYPQLENLYVEVRPDGDMPGAGGEMSFVGGFYEHMAVRRGMLMDDQLSVILHEVQHWIQRHEGFADGGDPAKVYERIKKELGYNDNRMQQLRPVLQFFYAPKYALDNLKLALRLHKNPNHYKQSGERFAVYRWGDTPREVADKMIRRIADRYEQERQKDLITLDYNYHFSKLADTPERGEYTLPMCDFSNPESVQAAIEKVKGLPSRRRRFRGMAPQVDRELDELHEVNTRLQRLADKFKFEPTELYMRLAGEIESRNVQARRYMTAEARERVPFNATLDYEGEAIVLSYSMEAATARALDVLAARADEKVTERLLTDIKRAVQRWACLPQNEQGRLGNGTKALAEMLSLFETTRSTLEGAGWKMGAARLNGLLKWAQVYADMQQSGAVPRHGVLQGDIYERFVQGMSRADEKNRLQGMTDAEAREALALIAGERMDAAVLKVAAFCREQLDAFMKARCRERMDVCRERLYPKREEGKPWPRGRMSADMYRRVEQVYSLMELKPDEAADRLEAAKNALDELDPEAADYEERQAALEDEVALLATFGCWEKLSLDQARKAEAAFTDMVLTGRNAWQDKLRTQRRRAAWWRKEIMRHFKTKPEEELSQGTKRTAAERGKVTKAVQKFVEGHMNLSQLMIALAPHLGQQFTNRQRARVAKMHEDTMQALGQLEEWMYAELASITGLKSEGEIEAWMNANNQQYDTGIVLHMPQTQSVSVTPDEAREWLRMTPEARERKRREMQEEAERKMETPDNIPPEEMMEELLVRLVRSWLYKSEAGRAHLKGELDAAKEQRGRSLTEEEYKAVCKRVQEELVKAADVDDLVADEPPARYTLKDTYTVDKPLTTTKEAMLFAILTFEQPDYVHLLEYNGMDETTLQRMRDAVGPQLLEWGYAMRDKLNENGMQMADVYEEWTGIPFGSRENYFRGVFDVGAMRDKGESPDKQGGTAAGGGKHGILIPRRFHNQRIPWQNMTSATNVFLQTMQEQQGYITTAEFVHEWRGLMQDKEFDRALRAELGSVAVDMLVQWVDLFDGARRADARVNAVVNNWWGRLLGNYAVSALVMNAYTYVKQVSAILNGFIGGYVPHDVAVRDEGVAVLASQHIGVGDYAASLARVLSGNGAITAEQLKARGFMQYRMGGEHGKYLTQAARLDANRKVPGKVGRGARKLTDAGMDLIGTVDLKSNMPGMLALADCTYRKLKARNDGSLTDEQIRELALDMAGMAMDTAAQPVLKTQKGFFAAHGGLFGGMGNLLYLFKSESVAKFGTFMAQTMGGEKRHALGGALMFGTMNALILAVIAYVKGQWPDDDDEDKWAKLGTKFALDMLTNDLTSVPMLGELAEAGRYGVESAIQGTTGAKVKSKAWHQRSPLLEPFYRAGKEYENVENGASWDKHLSSTAALMRSVGAASGFCSNSTIGPLSTASSLALAAAAFGNLSKAVKDLGMMFSDESDE